MLHETINYEEFVKVLEMNKLEGIDFTNTEIQQFYIFYSIAKNNDIDNPTIYKNFFNLTKEKIILTKSQISKIRAQIIDKYKDLNLEEVIGKIKNDVPNLILLVNDIKYNVKIKNKYVDREHRIIIFGKKIN